jgi:hypothetical protein
VCVCVCVCVCVSQSGNITHSQAAGPLTLEQVTDPLTKQLLWHLPGTEATRMLAALPNDPRRCKATFGMAVAAGLLRGHLQVCVCVVCVCGVCVWVCVCGCVCVCVCVCV